VLRLGLCARLLAAACTGTVDGSGTGGTCGPFATLPTGCVKL